MKLLGVIFTLMGVVHLIVGGILFYIEFSFQSKAVQAQGWVTEVVKRSGSESGDNYYPVIEFRNDMGQKFSFESGNGASEPEYKIGDGVTVSYDPKDPENAEIAGYYDMIYIGAVFGAIGVVFGSIGSFFLIRYIRRQKEIAWLKQNGTPVQADFSHVHHDTSYKVNGKSPYIIICNWDNPYTGATMQFKSEHIWIDPKPFIQQPKLTVLIDINDPKRHYIDTSFLPDKKR